jgi:undecaprenyl-diphosphatase
MEGGIVGIDGASVGAGRASMHGQAARGGRVRIKDSIGHRSPSGVKAWIARRELRALVAMLAGAVILLACAVLADEAMEGDTQVFDERLLLVLRSAANLSDPIGPSWFEETMRDFTGLGGTGVLALVTLAAAGDLVITQKARAALLVMGAILAGLLASQALRWGFDRPRPDPVPHGMQAYAQSFPSGHSMMSALVYLTLGALLARTQSRRRVKAYLLGLAGVLTVIVGVSRVCLGVHWPTDVLAGWALGLGWAMLSVLVMLRLQRRGAVEAEDGPAAMDLD